MRTEPSTAARRLINEAVARRILLWGEGGQLRFRAPAGAVTEQFRVELRQQKATLMELLREPSFISRGPQSEVPFLAFYQGLWDKIRSGRLSTSFTNMQWAVEVTGPFDSMRVVQSAQSLLARHPILSARVSEVSGAACFELGGPVTTELADFSALSGESGSIAAREALEEILWRPFRAEIDPLFRPFSIRITPERHYAGFVLNHLVGDLSSMTTLVVDLVRQWTSSSVQPTTPSPLHYSDYILAMNEWLASPALAARLVYWETHLTGASHCRLPPGRVVDDDERTEVKDFDFFLGVERASRVHAIANRLGATVYFVLLAAHARALELCSDRRDLILLAMHHGRDRMELWNTIGSFQNQIPLRITWREDDSFDALVSRCKQTHLAALTHVVPYHYVRGILPSLGIRECFPEFNCFVFGGPQQKNPPAPEPAAARMNGLAIAPVTARPQSSLGRVGDFQDHKLTLRTHANDIAGRVTYLPAEHDESSIARFVACFHEVIDTAHSRGELRATALSRQ
jgi:hypothetical protein